MAIATIPTCIEILHIVAKYLESTVPVIKAGEPKFLKLKSIITSQIDLSDSDDFLADKEMILTLQLAILTGLSMYEGVFVPSLKRIKEKDALVSISWEGGIQDKFTLGQVDADFRSFSKYFFKRVLGFQGGQKLPFKAIEKLASQLRDNSQTLFNVFGQMKDIIEGVDNLNRFFTDNMNRELLFVFMSAMPIDELNALFIYIYDFFPEELKIKGSGGSVINAASYFPTPSSDPHFLIEKIKLYHDLYYSNDHPIIKEITRIKTKEFLVKLSHNQQVISQIKLNMASTIQNQFLTRQNLTAFFVTFFDELFKK